MLQLERLFRKKKRLVVGLMSGTSADGIDAALVEVSGSGTRTRLCELAFKTYPFPRGFKKFLLKNSEPDTARIDEIARLNMLIAHLFADAALHIIRSAHLRSDDVDMIGSHGQTIQHLPTQKPLFGKNIRTTFQIGSPAAIAKLSGIVTVGDFRTADIAVGGSGAPLVPLFDFLTLRSTNHGRAALNIGGIANITVLPLRCTIDQVFAFDTGPGNMVVDALMMKLFGQPMDRDGRIARKGKIVPSLLAWMMTHPYVRERPPKSTGRETFGQLFVKELLHRSRRVASEDIITTATEFTALTVYESYLKFIRKRTHIDEIFVSGGGAHNTYLMEALQRYFRPIIVTSASRTSFSPDAKEAVCFALLANETIAGHCGNVPAATGARRPTILGQICLP